MTQFIPKTVLITGATGGIGSALAEQYAAPGMTLILTGRHKGRLQEVGNNCESKGAIVVTKSLDMTDYQSLTLWLNTVLEKYSIDLAIANAGISSGVNHKGEWETQATVTELFSVNLHAVIHLLHPIIQHMRIKKNGQIAIMSSLAAFRGLPQSPAYCASKAAVKVYGESLRALLKNDKVWVSIICPGFVKTQMTEKLAGPKPFLLSAEEAALIIKHKLHKKSSQIVFPFQLHLGMKLLNLFPNKIADSLLLKVKAYIHDHSDTIHS